MDQVLDPAIIDRKLHLLAKELRGDFMLDIGRPTRRTLSRAQMFGLLAEDVASRLTHFLLRERLRVVVEEQGVWGCRVAVKRLVID